MSGDGTEQDSTGPNHAPDVEGAPGDREFHLRRVCARFPTRLSARRLAMLAEILADDPPG